MSQGIIRRLLPAAMIKQLFVLLLRLLYRVELRGIENYALAGERMVIVANHVSFLDAVLIASFLPGRLTFTVDSYIAQRWWVKLGLSLVDFFTIDPTRPLATRALIKVVEAGQPCVIFPEGRITLTGALMKIYEGSVMVADKSDAMILPLRIDGAQYTPFSRIKSKVRVRWFPKITLTLMPPQKLGVDPALRGRARRRAIGLKLYDVMTRLIFATSDHRRSLFAALLEARKLQGGGQEIVEDISRASMTYDRLLARSFALGHALAAISAPGERVGVLLPNSAAAAVAFFALIARGRVPSLLNYTSGAAGMSATAHAAQLRTVVTSRAFLTAARLEATAQRLGEEVRLLYLEDIAAGIGRLRRLAAWAQARCPHLFAPRDVGPDDAAVVLFTSGSEGTPKGVVLSHANILANRYQMGALVDFTPKDMVFNALPIFHSFGLTGGLLLPLLAGVKTFLYVSPLHFRLVPQLVYDTNATILFGTDTFLAGYARGANAYDFYNLRHVFAGAERVREETLRVWGERFGLRILEGYGATEMSPVIAVNTPMQSKSGSAGRFLPGIEWHLAPVEGIAEGGRLFLKGPNLMLGYLRAEAPGRLEPPPDGVYDSGDIVAVDGEGFVAILGRAKRFAKIAGEMVSLAAVEALAARLWPDNNHAVVALPDSRKGEQLVLVTDHATASREALLAEARATGMPELFLPRTILPVERLPLLGSGKPDYKAIAELVPRLVPASGG
jgi:acyl-[acyl-carrier-protein]-phospholipid O-acyltransferase/long-chain-fatty-acid--[acyl-carrier-protein] ligase